MWTKHINKNGRAFYFNSVYDKSVWQPPTDSLVHEAANLQESCWENAERIRREDTSYTSDAVQSAASDDTKNLTQTITNTNVSQSGVSSTSANGIQSHSNPPRPEAIAVKPASKRFRVDSEEDQNENTKESSSYLQQKAMLEKQAGCGGDEAGKWLVR